MRINPQRKYADGTFCSVCPVLSTLANIGLCNYARVAFLTVKVTVKLGLLAPSAGITELSKR